MQFLNDPPLPSPPQLQAQYCFLSPYEERDKLRLDLNHSVRFHCRSIYPTITMHQLSSKLMVRYGGSAANWGIKRVMNGYLVKLPDWISNDHIYADARYWEEYSFSLRTWWSLNYSYALHQPMEITTTLQSFPHDFRHPYYYRQATSSMGVLIGVIQNVGARTEQGQVRLRSDSG